MTEALVAERARRWWAGRAQITTAAKAKQFIDDVGFALLFPRRNVDLPNLWDRARDDPTTEAWGPDIQRVWKWKDEFPRTATAWYGDFLAGHKSFLSPETLAQLYPRSGEPDDFRSLELSDEARRVAEVLLASGPTPSSVLREAAGLAGKPGRARFTRALAELGRHLVVTHFGTEEEKAGWPSAVLELTARVFAVPAAGTVDDRRRRAAAKFVDTMIEAHPKELGRAFGWPVATARTVLDELHQTGPTRPATRPSTAPPRRPIPKG